MGKSNIDPNKQFVHLHVHTDDSLLDGLTTVDELIYETKTHGFPAVAVTNHGNMGDFISFYKESKIIDSKNKKNDKKDPENYPINPIMGIETYIVDDRFKKGEGASKGAHLVLLAKNYEGFQNLLKLSSRASIEGVYYNPRIDKKLLKEFSAGLIMLTACYKGDIPNALASNNIELADKHIQEYLEIFPREDIYIELQANGVEEQPLLNAKLFNFAKKHNLKIVGTNDNHYLKKEDKEIQDLVFALNEGETVISPKRKMKASGELYYKSYDEMYNAFYSENPEYIANGVLSNTIEIANKCNVDIPLRKFSFPDYKIEDSDLIVDEDDLKNSLTWAFAENEAKKQGFETVPQEEMLGYINKRKSAKFLRKKSYEGAILRYGELTEELSKRLEYELDVMEKMGFPEYFIVVYDFMKYCRDTKIPIGPGRGSAGGSMVAYALGITDLDPIKYGLLFERFLNPERISMPDIDVDISQEHRQKVIDYVIEKYGSDKVAQIITFGTMKAKTAFRDVARVLGDIPATESNEISSLITEKSIELSISSNPDLQNLYNSDSRVKKALDLAKKLQGKKRHASAHASGVIISGVPIEEKCSLVHKDGVSLTQIEGDVLEETGLIKMDFLGLKNLDVIQRAFELIESKYGQIIKKEDLYEFNDPSVYEFLRTGLTKGIFQLESPGMADLLVRMNIDSFNDLIACLALYRPGPLGSGMDNQYIKGKLKGEISYPDPCLEPVLKETYGVFLYQELVMKIAQVYAGFSLGQADNLRKAMGKKDEALMEKQLSVFINGAKALNRDPVVAETLFNQIRKFAEYGFNKSHSTTYACISYITAWQKTHYPLAFMASLLEYSKDDADKMISYCEDINQLGFKIAPPDINKSETKFTIKPEDKSIVFSLAGIKGIGEKLAQFIIEDRNKNGKFLDVYDFYKRTKSFGTSSKTLEALTYAGAFDSFGINRRTIIENIEDLIKFVDKQSTYEEKNKNQMSLFSVEKKVFTFTPYEDFTDDVKSFAEFEAIAFYISGHPIEKYQNLFYDKIESIYKINFLKKCLVRKGIETGLVSSEDSTEIGGLSSDDFFPIDEYLTPKGKNPLDYKVSVIGIIKDFKISYSEKINSKTQLPYVSKFLRLTLEDATGTINVIGYNKDVEDMEMTYGPLAKKKFVCITGYANIEEFNNTVDSQIKMTKIEDLDIKYQELESKISLDKDFYEEIELHPIEQYNNLYQKIEKLHKIDFLKKCLLNEAFLLGYPVKELKTKMDFLKNGKNPLAYESAVMGEVKSIFINSKKNFFRLTIEDSKDSIDVVGFTKGLKSIEDLLIEKGSLVFITGIPKHNIYLEKYSPQLEMKNIYLVQTIDNNIKEKKEDFFVSYKKADLLKRDELILLESKNNSSNQNHKENMIDNQDGLKEKYNHQEFIKQYNFNYIEKEMEMKYYINEVLKSKTCTIINEIPFSLDNKNKYMKWIYDKVTFLINNYGVQRILCGIYPFSDMCTLEVLAYIKQHIKKDLIIGVVKATANEASLYNDSYKEDKIKGFASVINFEKVIEFNESSSLSDGLSFSKYKESQFGLYTDKKVKEKYEFMLYSSGFVINIQSDVESSLPIEIAKDSLVIDYKRKNKICYSVENGVSEYLEPFSNENEFLFNDYVKEVGTISLTKSHKNVIHMNLISLEKEKAETSPYLPTLSTNTSSLDCLSILKNNIQIENISLEFLDENIEKKNEDLKSSLIENVEISAMGSLKANDNEGIIEKNEIV